VGGRPSWRPKAPRLSDLHASQPDFVSRFRQYKGVQYSVTYTAIYLDSLVGLHLSNPSQHNQILKSAEEIHRQMEGRSGPLTGFGAMPCTRLRAAA
jgi:hypothetical protein